MLQCSVYMSLDKARSPSPPPPISLCLNGGIRGIRIFRRENKQDLEIRGNKRKHTARQTLAPFTHEALSRQSSSLFPGPGGVGWDRTDILGNIHHQFPTSYCDCVTSVSHVFLSWSSADVDHSCWSPNANGPRFYDEFGCLDASGPISAPSEDILVSYNITAIDVSWLTKHEMEMCWSGSGCVNINNDCIIPKPLQTTKKSNELYKQHSILLVLAPLYFFASPLFPLCPSIRWWCHWCRDKYVALKTGSLLRVSPQCRGVEEGDRAGLGRNFHQTTR